MAKQKKKSAKVPAKDKIKKAPKKHSELAQNKKLKQEAIEDLERVELARKKFRCLPFSFGCFLAIVLALCAPVITYALAATNLAGNLVWYVTAGVFFGLLLLLFLGALIFRKKTSSLSLGLLFGLAFSLIIILVAAAALLLVLVWVGKSTQIKA